MGLVTRKPVFGVSAKAYFKPVSSATETSCSKFTYNTFQRRITKVLIRLRGCAGWSAPVLFATPEDRFSPVEAHIVECKPNFKRNIPEVFNISNTLLKYSLLSAEFLDLKFQNSDILQSLIVLNLTLIESGLLYLDLLVQKSKLIITSHQLSTKNISLADYLYNKQKSLI